MGDLVQFTAAPRRVDLIGRVFDTVLEIHAQPDRKRELLSGMLDLFADAYLPCDGEHDGERAIMVLLDAVLRPEVQP